MKVTIEIKPDAVAYVFANAFHYEWFRALRLPKTPQPEAFARLAQTIFEDKNHGKLPMLAACGGSVEVQALDPETDKPRWYTVTAADLERGFRLSIENGVGGKYLPQLIDGSADVNACDCWLQYAVFGKLVYG
jgi:hypothetical protein